LKHTHYLAEHINRITIPNYGTYKISVSDFPLALLIRWNLCKEERKVSNDAGLLLSI